MDASYALTMAKNKYGSNRISYKNGGSKTSYSKKTRIITLTFDDGSIKLKEFGSTATFHINDDVYKISNGKFKKQ